MGSKPQTKRHSGEQSAEAKSRINYSEPTTVNDELKALGRGIIKSTWEDLLGATGSTFSEQVLGFGVSGNLQEGQEVSLKKKQQEKKEEKSVTTSEHMEYFRSVNNADRMPETRMESEIRNSVDQIRMEIKKLIQTSKIVEKTVKDATADKAPVKPGKYHISFFEFVLSVVREATRKLEDSASYGAIFTSKKQQSKYWSSYKKQGTTFGLSGERTVATQTG